MTTARLEAAMQSHRAEFRQKYVGCRECQRPLSIENQIEKFCDDCGTVTPVEICEGKL